MHSSKRLLRLALSGALAASMFIPSSLAVYQAQVKADSLYLRESPGGEDDVMARAPAAAAPYPMLMAATSLSACRYTPPSCGMRLDM